MSPVAAQLSLKEATIQELDAEMKYTRTMLERVPEEKFSWKPHSKSMTLGHLSTFLAFIPAWGVSILDADSFDVSPHGVAVPDAPVARSRQEVLEIFDKNSQAVRTALATSSDEQLATTWTLLAAGKVIFARPRLLAFNTYFLNHAVHHRAQLGLYLRMNDVAVPAIYRDSADEKGGMFIGA